MKTLLRLLTFYCLCVPVAQADPLLIGRWHYTITRYRGAEIPRPNPNLLLTFEFAADGFSRLMWSYRGEPGRCEQRSMYKAGNGRLEQKVVWVSPENRFDCGSDPDMQVGRQTTTVYRIREGNLETDFPLGEDILTYVWIKEKSARIR